MNKPTEELDRLKIIAGESAMWEEVITPVLAWVAYLEKSKLGQAAADVAQKNIDDHAKTD